MITHKKNYLYIKVCSNVILSMFVGILFVIMLLGGFATKVSMEHGERDNLIAMDIADDGTIATSFSGGSGIETDPYFVSTPMQLRLLSETNSYWGSENNPVYFKLTNDIVLNATNWAPIGNSDKAFYGVFDGCGYTITFQNEITMTLQYCGLWGHIINSVIKNLSVNWVEGISVSDNDFFVYASTLVGYAEESTITKCNTDGSLVATGGDYVHAGGIAGISNGEVEYCYNFSNIRVINDNGSSYGGGIIGYAEEGSTISYCYNAGEIQAEGASGYFVYSGGIVGDTNGCLINDSYNLGRVKAINTYGASLAGGIMAFADSGVINIIRSYNLSSVVASSDNEAYSGGIIGSIYDGTDITIVNCFCAVGTEDNAPTAISTNGLSYVGGIIAKDGVILNCYYDYANTSNGAKQNDNETQDMKKNNLLLLVKSIENFGTNGALIWSTSVSDEGDSYAWDFSNDWGIDENINGGFPTILALYEIMITYVYDYYDFTQNIVQTFNIFDTEVVILAGNNIFTKEGYTFIQWTDGNNYFDINSPVTLSQNLTLYPVWEQIADITLSFYGNDNVNLLVLVMANDKIIGQSILFNGLMLSISTYVNAEISITFVSNLYCDLDIEDNDNLYQENGMYMLYEFINTQINYNANQTNITNSFII